MLDDLVDLLIDAEPHALGVRRELVEGAQWRSSIVYMPQAMTDGVRFAQYKDKTVPRLALIEIKEFQAGGDIGGKVDRKASPLSTS